MNTLSARWEEVGTLLREGRNCLARERKTDHNSPVPVGPLTGTLDEFEEFLEHNELELAWDALEAVAERLNAPPSCWHLLAQAATLMDLSSKAEAAERRAAVP